ncbi:interleukin-9 [Suricata suricatta]|uniref:interleukin-9 n=1 Tax=Suricata suricatta TaxID=37032 RepID=UPI001155CCB7|nr:interleukin-9 [Suricata suricatta]
MLLPVVLASALLLASVASQRCSTFPGPHDVTSLINKLQVTNCLCLPVPSDNCTTPCFREALSQMTNSTVPKRFPEVFNRLKRTVERLSRNQCQSFSCEPPCNQTTTGNTLTFLKSLQEVFQKEKMKLDHKEATGVHVFKEEMLLRPGG